MATVSDERLTQLIDGHSTWANTNSMRPQIDRDTAAALTELQSLRSQAGVSEAVAWRWKHPLWPGTHFQYGTHDPRIGTDDGVEAQPLFARPAPIEITEEMIERAMERAGWVTKPTPSEYESGNLIDNGISEEEAAEINAQLTIEMREILQSALQGETK